MCYKFFLVFSYSRTNLLNAENYHMTSFYIDLLSYIYYLVHFITIHNIILVNEKLI